MQDYGDEVKDFFTADKQLAAELEYDMRRYQEQLAEQQEPVRQAARGPRAGRREGSPAPVCPVPPHTHLGGLPLGGTASEGLPVAPAPLESHRVPVGEGGGPVSRQRRP